ncbi:MAG: hypothetical protein ACYC6M_14710, partial [Terriglobales bacterium]
MAHDAQPLVEGPSRRTLGSLLWFLGVVLVGAMNLGVNCNPVGGGLGECGCTYPQYSICARCIAPVDLGQPCSSECGPSPCASGYLCFGAPPDGSVGGKCVSSFGSGIALTLTTPGAACNSQQSPSQTNCGTDTYCLSQKCPLGNGFKDGQDHCTIDGAQGDLCDQPVVGLPPGSCAQCEPGTTCTNGACAKGCGSYQDCQGCGPYTACLQLQGVGPTGTTSGAFQVQDVTTFCENGQGDCAYGNCYDCRPHGGSCDDGHPCCSVGDTCHVFDA